MTGKLSDDDILVWRAVARTAKPLPGRVLLQPGADKPKPKSKLAPPSQRAAPAPPPVPQPPVREDARRPAPAELSGDRRIRRGKVEIDAKLDLHGMTQIQARAALGAFLSRQRAAGARIVLVVTGKGRAGEGVLRAAIPAWLRELAEHVSGYAPAHARHGGSGALYIRLRRPN